MFVPFGIKVYEQKNAIKKDYRLGSYYITEEKYRSMSGFSVQPRDIIVSCAGTIGETYILPEDAPIGIINQALMRVRLYFYPIKDYWCMMFDNILQTESRMKGAGSAIKNIPPFDYLKAVLVPIPPYNEQKRIIEKYMSICRLIEKYDKVNIELNSLNTAVYAQIKHSILQEAIQGRLVPQDSTDEPALVLLDHIREEKQKLMKEGKLKKKDVVDSVIFKGEDNKYYEKIDGKVLDINDEIPFDIPESWTWVRLQQVCTYIHRGKSPKYSEVRKYPVIAQKCNQWDGFHIEKAQFIAPESVPLYAEDNLLQDKDLLWNSTGLGTLGRIGLYPESSNPYGFAVADSHVTVIRTLPEFIRPEYLLMFFSSPTVQSVIEDKASGSTKQKELATETVKSYIVPIPPLAEQDRILDKYKTVLESWS